jgi:hypothetical protein
MCSRRCRLQQPYCTHCTSPHRTTTTERLTSHRPNTAMQAAPHHHRRAPTAHPWVQREVQSVTSCNAQPRMVRSKQDGQTTNVAPETRALVPQHLLLATHARCMSTEGPAAVRCVPSALHPCLPDCDDLVVNRLLIPASRLHLFPRESGTLDPRSLTEYDVALRWGRPQCRKQAMLYFLRCVILSETFYQWLWPYHLQSSLPGSRLGMLCQTMYSMVAGGPALPCYPQPPGLSPPVPLSLPSRSCHNTRTPPTRAS